MKSFKRYHLTEGLSHNHPFHKLFSARARGTSVGNLVFAFKESKFSYWIYSRDGWFRSNERNSKGYGVMFRSMVLGGGKITDTGDKWIVNVRGTFLPSVNDTDVDSQYEKFAGKLFIDQDVLGFDQTKIKEIIEWINTQAKNRVWMP